MVGGAPGRVADCASKSSFALPWRVYITDLVSVRKVHAFGDTVLVIQAVYHIQSSLDLVRSGMLRFSLPTDSIPVEMVALALVISGRRIPAKLP